MDLKQKEMVALGASVTANCVACVKYHLTKAREAGLSEEEISFALEVGKMVRRGAAGKLDEVLEKQTPAEASCGPVLCEEEQRQ